MNIVVPTNGHDGLSELVAEHFGRCKTYTFINESGELIKVIPNNSEHMGGSGLPPELMKQNDADVLLCKGLGFKAINLCAELGINVYVGKERTVKEIFDSWKNNNLKKAGSEDACR